MQILIGNIATHPEEPPRPAFEATMSTDTILIVIVLILLFGGGGFFWSRRK